MAALFALALAAPALGADAPEAAANDAPSQLEAVEKGLGETNAQLEHLAEARRSLKADLAALSDRLVAVAARLQAAEQRASATEERLKALNETEATLSVELARNRETLADLLAGLQQIDRNPPPPIVTGRDDAVAAVRGAMLFAALLPQVRARTLKVTQTLARLGGVRTALAGERQALDAELARLAAARAEIDALLARKAALAKAAGEEYAEQSRKARELAKQAANLKELMAALERQRAAEAARIERERRKQAERQAREAAEAHARATARLEAQQREAVLQPPAPKAFAGSRGRLDYPAQGQVVRGFADADGFGGASKGMFIATRPEAQVVAPAAGRVEFAGEFRSYGQLLILDVGGGYHVLLAGLGALAAATGQTIRAGEPLGTMGKEPARSTLIGDLLEDRRPILYVEFRQNGGAIDPSPWWIGARREARG
jgi:septal ring factor EnvC (AmiA/AmiB activator)